MNHRQRKKREARRRKYLRMHGKEGRGVGTETHAATETASPGPRASYCSASNPPGLTAVTHAIVAIAINAWRAKRRMVCDNGEPTTEAKKYYRPVEGILNALAELGVVTKDYTGEPYDAGMAVRAIAFDPTDSVDREVINETVTPSLFWNGRFIHMGEVVVATPRTPLQGQRGSNREKPDEQKHD